MDELKSLSEIDYSKNVPIAFLATVISVDSDGDGEKRPFKATLKLETTGENFQICSWKFSNLQTFKDLVHSDKVYRFEGFPSLYRDTDKQIRIGEIKDIGQVSTKKIYKELNAHNIKQEILAISNTYIPENSPYIVYKRIIDELVFKNEKFWSWPAATKMHHAYPLGLAKHTLSTLKNAIAIWKNYEGSNANIALVVAGAILHDIGKITEYNQDGSRTTYGNLIPHPVAGYSKIFAMSQKLGLDPEKDTKIIMLLHVILTHHEKIEFGASTQPNILEAFIVARADILDMVMDVSTLTLDNQEINETSDRIPALDGARLFKWHN